jgi:hypothetical protein
VAIQNRLSAGFAVTLEVNGQDIERRYVPAMTQEIFAVDAAMVQQTEQQTGVTSADIPFLGKTTPFVIRFKDYISEDDHLIQNTNFILAPTNQFENKVSDDISDDGSKVDAHFVNPGAFVVVVDPDVLDVIELDRELLPVNETGDNPDVIIEGQDTSSTAAEYLNEEVLVLQQIDLLWLLGGDMGTQSSAPAPGGQIVVSDEDPFDSDAVALAMRDLVADDLSDYDFSGVFILQNRLDWRVGVTLEVNGQDIERRIINPHAQETFVVDEDMILETEQDLSVTSATVDDRLEGRLCPFVVRLKNYVTEEGHIMQNSDFLLAPQNIFETMSTKESLAQDTPYMLDGNLFCPGGFVIVLKQDHADVVELDREHVGLNETADDVDVVIDYKSPEDFIYHPETLQALAETGLDYILTNP